MKKYLYVLAVGGVIPAKAASEGKEWPGATLKNVVTLGGRSAAGLPDASGMLVLERPRAHQLTQRS